MANSAFLPTLIAVYTAQVTSRIKMTKFTMELDDGTTVRGIVTKIDVQYRRDMIDVTMMGDSVRSQIAGPEYREADIHVIIDEIIELEDEDKPQRNTDIRTYQKPVTEKQIKKLKRLIDI